MKELDSRPRAQMATLLILALGAILSLSGCSTPLVLNSSIGPNPFLGSNQDANGQLQVFTMNEEAETFDFSFPRYERSAYGIYAENGKRIKRVENNNCGYYDSTPPTISLPPGNYLVEGFMAEGFGQLTVVHVEIKPGRKTEVHLDGDWSLPDFGSPRKIVRAPNGFMVGWRTADR